MIKKGARVRISKPTKEHPGTQGETGRIASVNPVSQFGPYDVKLDDGTKIYFLFEEELEEL